MKIFFPIAKVDTEQREVWGYASTEARDEQGDVVTREALTSALGDYMKFANIREMHQLSAVGVAKEAGVDDKGLFVGAKIVDDLAWRKIVEGVYKGYSIGGRVTRRDPADRQRITGLVLHEISLVDRPANPDAVFDYWKAAAALAESGARGCQPLQIWACGIGEHRHLAKAEAVDCLDRRAVGEPRAEADPAREESTIEEAASGTGDEPYGDVEYADPGYPIDPAGPPAAAGKAVTKIGHIARLLVDLDWLRGSLADEAPVEADGSPRLARLEATAAELCTSLKALVSEEDEQTLDTMEDGADPDRAALGKIQSFSSGPGATAASADFAKALADERAEKAALIASLAEIVPRLDQLRRRVEDIAQIPLPPATLAKGIVSISKQQDAASCEPPFSGDDIAAAFARMSPEDQTLALIKASRARPIRPPGFPTPPPRDGQS